MKTDSKQSLRHNWLVSSILTIGLLAGCTTPTKQPTDAASPTATETPAPTAGVGTQSSPKVGVTYTMRSNRPKSYILFALTRSTRGAC